MARRACVTCRHHSMGDFNMKQEHLCAADYDVVTGENFAPPPCLCEWMRQIGAKCGLYGELWEPK